MPARDHVVSHRNGPQIMVSGLSLRDDLGYCRGARVTVTDPADPVRQPWTFVVANDEHATLSNRTPPPPAWIQKGVRVRIEVQPPVGSHSSRKQSTQTASSSSQRKTPDRNSPAQLIVERSPERPTLFDAYLMIDWGSNSSRYRPGDREDAPWLAEARWRDATLVWEPEIWFPTRRALLDHSRSRLLEHIKERRRVLMGFDFPYGYPSGYGAALHLTGPAYWQSIWAEISVPTAINPGVNPPPNQYATANNINNRFVVASHLNRRIGINPVGPLYGCPAVNTTRWFTSANPGFPFPTHPPINKYRIVEQRLINAGYSPLSCWWILGGGAPVVGGQILTGIPSVAEIRQEPSLNKVSIVWPFESGFTAKITPKTGPRVIHAEIWPGIIPDRVADLLRTDRNLIRDQAQVRAMVEWSAQRDANGTLGGNFDVPANLDDADRVRCEREEGWILGA